MTINIYIADDDLDDQYLIRQALYPLPKELALHFFCSGDDLITHLDTTPVNEPGLAILDLNMPQMGGLECLKHLRNSIYKNLPIVIFTTSDNTIDITNSYECGANIYLTKPAAFSELQLLLNKVINFYFSERMDNVKL